MPACRATRSPRSAAAIPPTTPPRCAACSQGEPGAYRDAVLLNAAAALVVAGRGDDLRDGVEEAAEAIDNGLANALLDCWIAYCMTNILDRILETKRAEVAARKADDRARRPRRAPIAAQTPPRGFRAALDAKAATGYALIAEIKKASPSKGLIRADFDPPAHARAYAGRRRGLPVGADRRALFPGRTTPISIAARAACSLPVLRKDFMVDPWQVDRSARASAPTRS